MQLHNDPNLILDYVEGELSPEASRRFEARCAQDASLAGLVEELIEDRRALRTLPIETPARDMPQTLVAPLERELLLNEGTASAWQTADASKHGDQRKSWRLLRWATYGSVAAALSLTVGVVLTNLAGTPLADRAYDLAQSAMPNGPALGETSDDARPDFDPDAVAAGSELALGHESESETTAVPASELARSLASRESADDGSQPVETVSGAVVFLDRNVDSAPGRPDESTKIPRGLDTTTQMARSSSVTALALHRAPAGFENPGRESRAEANVAMHHVDSARHAGVHTGDAPGLPAWLASFEVLRPRQVTPQEMEISAWRFDQAAGTQDPDAPGSDRIGFHGVFTGAAWPVHVPLIWAAWPHDTDSTR